LPWGVPKHFPKSTNTDLNINMSFGKLRLAVFAVVNLVNADWTTHPWDAIIVGAGPAGIVG
jgi:hypothetical protein